MNTHVESLAPTGRSPPSDRPAALLTGLTSLRAAGVNRRPIFLFCPFPQRFVIVPRLRCRASSSGRARSISIMRFFGNNLTCIRGERVVFANLDFSVSPGDAIILIGRNGTGKTSLLRVMAGLTRAAAGSLSWEDGAIADDPERHRRRLNYIGHLDCVKPVLTVRENLTSWARLRDASDDRVMEGLAKFGLDQLADIPGRYLSAGQRHRLSLARLGLTAAPLWLLDEPTIALDSDAVTALNHAIAAHRETGGMVVIATNVALDIHDPAMIYLGKFAANSEDALPWG